MAGNGTIALQILQDLPDPDAVVIPYGGGGLTGGIASAIKALRPRTRIITAEPETASGMAAALSGRPGTGKVVWVVSGGNINLSKLAEIIGGADGWNGA